MTTFPNKAWSSYELTIKALGERRPPDQGTDFLRELGVVADDLSLTEAGENLFKLKFVYRDDDGALAVLGDLLINFPPAAAICQFLAGVPGANKANAESMLRSQGMADGLSDRTLGSLLSLMSATNLIRYARGKIEVLTSLATLDEPPASIFISRATPYGNKVWLRRVLGECQGFIYWLDKHFLPMAFEPIWEVVDGTHVSDVKILSLKMEQNSGRKALREYRDLRVDLRGREVNLEWRVIDSGLIKDTHDRWIIGSTSARNVPDVGTIYSGNNSELNLSSQSETLQRLFLQYWEVATPIVE